ASSKYHSPTMYPCRTTSPVLLPWAASQSRTFSMPADDTLCDSGVATFQSGTGQTSASAAINVVVTANVRNANTRNTLRRKFIIRSLADFLDDTIDSQSLQHLLHDMHLQQLAEFVSGFGVPRA